MKTSAGSAEWLSKGSTATDAIALAGRGGVAGSAAATAVSRTAGAGTLAGSEMRTTGSTEPVAPLRHRLDVGRAAALVAERATQLADTARQDLLGSHAPPDLLEQRVPLDELARVLCEEHEHVHHLRLHVLRAVGAGDSSSKGLDVINANAKPASETRIHVFSRMPERRRLDEVTGRVAERDRC